MASKPSSYTRSPMEDRLHDELRDIRKLPAKDKTPVSECLSTLAIVVLEHEQKSHNYRRAITEDIGNLTAKQEEVLNMLRNMRNGNGNGKPRNGNGAKNILQGALENWKWIVTGMVASGGTIGGLLDFFGFF